MSNYFGKAVNPATGEYENAEFLDDHFGRHRYGVRFADGKVWRWWEVFFRERKVGKEWEAREAKKREMKGGKDV
ncbi:hypothetical protein [Kordiimonas sp.]|uniref:hypothetical protein n=1 Tax=Kordiimonas sp. TaxID=1970157 RepID=UPI003A8F1F0C